MKINYSPLIVLLSCSILFSCTKVEEVEWESGEWIDLTHEFSEETLYWPTSEPFKMDTVFVGITDAGFYYESYSVCTAEHGGTHLDAPIHFYENRNTVEQIEIDQLVGRAVVVDVVDKVEEDRNYQIRISDLTDWESEHGAIPDDSILLFYTGLSAYWPDAVAYLGTDKRDEEGVAELQFAGIHPETAQWLVDHRNIKAVGLDTASLDYGGSVLYETHQILFEQNIAGFENVANLDQLPATGAFVIALPMKIKDGSGAPLRIVAHVRE